MSGPAGFIERRPVLARVDRGLRQGEVRLRELGIVRGEAAHELQRRLLVLGVRERPGELRKSAGRVRRRAREELFQTGQRFVVAPGGHQQPAESLKRARRAGLGLVPNPRGVDRSAVHPRVERDLGGAARDPGIAGALREVDVRLRGEPEIAALAGDLCEQEFVEDILVQLLLGKRRAVFGLGGPRERFGRRRVRVGFVLRFLSGRGRLRRIRRASCNQGDRSEHPQRAERGEQKTCWIGHAKAPAVVKG